jgi:hypothetical protein
MMDPRRLLDGDASELELRLLSLAQREEAPSAAPRRLAAQLGLPAGLLGLDAAAHAADAAGSASTFPAAGVGLSSAGWLSGALGKLVLVGLVGSLGGAAWWFGGLEVASTSSNTAPSAGIRTTTTASTSMAPDTVTAPPSAATTAAATEQRSALTREVEALDRVRQAVRARDARAALRLLEDLERAHPARVLAQEAEALRVEALFAAGEGSAARARAEQFLAAHPHSPHAARVQALMRARGPQR